MEIRDRSHCFVNIIMRVPLLFVIDELLRMGLKVPEETVVCNYNGHGFQNVSTSSNEESKWNFFAQPLDTTDYFKCFCATYLMTITKFVACMTGEFVVSSFL